MVISYVVRLRTAALERGVFSGEVVAVASGRRFGIASLEQMASFCKRTCIEEEELSRHPVDTDEETASSLPWSPG